MKLLLDTHTLIWWWSNSSRLSKPAYEAITETRTAVFVSAASAWEISTKIRIGRLTLPTYVAQSFGESIVTDGFKHLPVNHQHALRAGGYPMDHGDPFDRMLAAQAELESLTLVTRDPAFQQFPVRVLW